MGYDPKQYKDLFPLGLFEFETKPIDTWFDSHRLFALNVTPLKTEEKVLTPGIVLKRGSIKQKGGFSNYMIFEIDPKVRKVNMEFFGSEMKYPLDAFKDLKSPKLLTNAGYFYLTDDESRDPIAPPKVRTGNMVIKAGELINLPILNRSSIVVYKDGTLDMVYLRAIGKLKLNSKEYDWVGSLVKNVDVDSFVIYNSSNIEIPVVVDPRMGPSRMAKETFIKAKKGQKLLVCKRTGGKFVVTEITTKKVLINDKDMVVGVPEDLDVKAKDTLEFTTIDSLVIDKVSSAVSIGPMLYPSYEKTKKQVEIEFATADMANPNNPHEGENKLARAALIKLPSGKLCSILVDGIPQAGEIYQGVTLEEFIDFINSKYPDYVSGVATDPSSTVKAVFNEDGKTVVFGNTHYLAHKKDENGKITFWPNGLLGRKLNSSLVVY